MSSSIHVYWFKANLNNKEVKTYRLRLRHIVFQKAIKFRNGYILPYNI